MSPNNQLALRGSVVTEVIRSGAVIARRAYTNLITNVAKNYALDAIFNGGSQVSTWYMSLISSVGYTALSASDTAASHSGWTEFTSYDEAARPEWTAGAAASQQVSNSAVVVFTASASGTIKGMFVVSSSTKGGTAGTLWAEALDPAGDLVVADGDVIRNTYTVAA